MKPAYKWIELSNTTIGMLLATVNATSIQRSAACLGRASPGGGDASSRKLAVRRFKLTSQVDEVARL